MYIWVKLEYHVFHSLPVTAYSDNTGWVRCPSCLFLPSHVIPNVLVYHNFSLFIPQLIVIHWNKDYWKTGTQYRSTGIQERFSKWLLDKRSHCAQVWLLAFQTAPEQLYPPPTTTIFTLISTFAILHIVTNFTFLFETL